LIRLINFAETHFAFQSVDQSIKFVCLKELKKVFVELKSGQ